MSEEGKRSSSIDCRNASCCEENDTRQRSLESMLKSHFQQMIENTFPFRAFLTSTLACSSNSSDESCTKQYSQDSSDEPSGVSVASRIGFDARLVNNCPILMQGWVHKPTDLIKWSMSYAILIGYNLCFGEDPYSPPQKVVDLRSCLSVRLADFSSIFTVTNDGQFGVELVFEDFKMQFYDNDKLIRSSWFNILKLQLKKVQLGTALHNAVKNKRVDDIIHLLNENQEIDVNFTVPSIGCNSLITAVAENSIECVELLLSCASIDVNISSEQGFTPLYVALKKNYLNIAEKLLKVPILKINKPISSLKRTALHIAVEKGALNLVRIMVNRNDINMNPVTQYNTTPLLTSVRNGNYEMTKTLLSGPEVDINITDYRGRSPIFMAASQNNVKILDLLKSTQMKSNSTFVICISNTAESVDKHGHYDLNLASSNTQQC
eukprot:gene12842-17216_t